MKSVAVFFGGLPAREVGAGDIVGDSVGTCGSVGESVVGTYFEVN
jgi:hypothetical protein